MKCVKSCRTKYGKRKSRKNKALKKCYKTCRTAKRGKNGRRGWNMKCVKSCRSKHGKRKNKALKKCFKTCRTAKRGKNGRRGWNMKCVKSCRQKHGRKVNRALKKCYKTCRTAKRGKNGRRGWNMKCVKACRQKHGRKRRAVPRTAAYRACLRRCQPGKRGARCRRACARFNRPAKIGRVVSPSSKAVAAALRGLKKKKGGKKSNRPETWEDVVRQSRHLLKRSVKLRNLINKQVARYQDTNDVEGRKYNGWWSIWDVLKGVKPAKHYTKRAKEIDSDVKQIVTAPINVAAHSKYGEIINVLKGADDSFSTKYTREIGSPAVDFGTAVDEYVEKPLEGAKIRTIPYNPAKPYEARDNRHVWKRSPPLWRLPEIANEPYDGNLKPVFAKDFKMPKRLQTDEPFALKTKNWDYPQIPYSYPVRMVKHNPKQDNPHVRQPTPGWHAEWPEYSSFAESPAAPTADAAQAAAATPANDAPQGAPMKEGTDF
jgi:hypothetical protein